ncbi:MAG TPA: phosphoribosylglycinamide formyltransferase [Sulfurivirga caldicuralii]|nr:phosphoribosylglycinamide formyltransferase [Sulfurivirga caldicuralii]
MKRVAVLISGSGTNLQALLDWQQQRGKACQYEIIGVLSNKADAYGLTRAEQVGVSTAVIAHGDFPDRESFDARLVETLETWQPDVVVLAGFMRILTPVFTDHFLGRAINIHPSLLPKYKGLNTHQRALAAGDHEHGVSIHYVTSDLDGGPIIAQQRVPIEQGDTADTLQQKVHGQEHRLYPRVVEAMARGYIDYCPPHACLQGSPLNPPLDVEQLNEILGLDPAKPV